MTKKIYLNRWQQITLPENKILKSGWILVTQEEEGGPITLDLVDSPRRPYSETLTWDTADNHCEWMASRKYPEPTVLDAKIEHESVLLEDVMAHISACMAECHTWQPDYEPEYCPSVRWTKEQRREARSCIPSYERCIDGE